MARTRRFELRLTNEERAALDGGVARFGGSPTTFIRRAINAALSQRPLLTSHELAEIQQAREAFRRAGVNLNGLLHEVYRFQGGAVDALPAAEEFRFMLDDVRTAMARYTDALKQLP